MSDEFKYDNETYDFDPWTTGTGLIESYTGEITDLYFTTDANYRNGEALAAKMIVKTNIQIGDDHEDTNLYGVGNGWEARDQGNRLVREDGGKKKINENTNYGRLIEAAIAAGAGDTFRSRGASPFTGDAWKGMIFEFENKKFPYKDRDTGEAKSFNVMLPVKFVGVSGKAEAGGKAESSKSDESNSATLPGPLRVKLAKLADECENHDEFIARAFDIEGVDGNAAAEAAVTDDGPGSIWQKAKG